MFDQKTKYEGQDQTLLPKMQKPKVQIQVMFGCQENTDGPKW